MSEPLVSIVTPSFNQGRFIRATLDSVLQQDYRRLELIVIDGGSTDETLDVLRSYDDPRLSWISEPDQGQSDALNKGMRRAQGQILSYLNSDDLLLPTTVGFAVRYFLEHPEVHVLYGDCDLIDPEGNWLSTSMGEPFDLVKALTGAHAIRQPGTFWTRAVYECIGDFNAHLHYTMDMDYWLRIGLAGFRLQYVPGRRAAFRVHGSSKSVSLQTGFLHDWSTMLDQIYTRPDLPPDIAACREASYAFVEWGWAKTYWQQRDFVQARPLLRKHLRSTKRGRQLVAAAMLVDSYLNTRLTHGLASLFRRATGREILFGERRVV